MSASPSGMSNGRTPTPTPNNGGAPQFTRKPKAADPLRPRKKPVRRPNVPSKPPGANLNGLTPARPNGPTSLNNFSGPRAPGPRGPIPINGNAAPRQTYGGWTHPPKGEVIDFPLFTTRRALRDGLRYHAMRFAGKKEVDPTNQDEFTRPISLHRRDPRQPPPGKAFKDEDTVMEDVVDSKERERQEILKAEKEAQKAADRAQIAPTGNNANAAAAKKAQAFRNEKTTQVHRLDKTAEQKKESDLRYEEALPWHLEDADNKNTWVGNYESALSGVNVMFYAEGSSFRMIPVEKWYKFTSKNKFNTLTIDEAEALLSKKTKESRWAMKTQERNEAQRVTEENIKGMNRLYTVKAESQSFRGSSRNETRDIDELDFDADDLFQDDDELPTVEPDRDEDTKDAQERIKQDQRGANLFGEADEEAVEKDFIKEEQELEAQKKLGKGVRKALTKREKNYIYDSDSSNPYASSDSEDDTSDEEKQKEIDKKKDEEAKAKLKAEAKTPGTLSKGNNTPSGRPKHTDPLKKSKSLKRAASPNLSESSGNESSRKKHKKKHVGSSQPTGQHQRKSSIVKMSVNASDLSRISSSPPNPHGATSDGEATGGEMSDGASGKKKKITLRMGGSSPTASRAASPAPGKPSSSRAGSPAQGTEPTAPSSSGPITPKEIIAALPSAGISIGQLLGHFRGRVGDSDGQTTKKEFMAMIKTNSKYGADKLLRPKV
ncbi:0cbbbaf8-c40e-4782-a477-cbe7feeb657a [Sclerotinia trifoliorum]|uniref:0cbbbaf8-c40e-4782-a477-cbe7feeb657a n=1 Tax=Sclerotinia trifoliorum TaxID=28548 RepID=A0A8H2ZTH5_9HELO|nr:0cbbbaf8-c40e-4782-a477-cbe7feeb657a [Sclerotinia trifoliorum]